MPVFPGEAVPRSAACVEFVDPRHALGGAAARLSQLAERAEADEAALQAYVSSARLSSRAQAYPSLWARLALRGERATGAAAVAVNFPAWGRACGLLRDALLKRGYATSRGKVCCVSASHAAALMDNTFGPYDYDAPAPPDPATNPSVMAKTAIFSPSPPTAYAAPPSPPLLCTPAIV